MFSQDSNGNYQDLTGKTFQTADNKPPVVDAPVIIFGSNGERKEGRYIGGNAIESS